MVSANGSLKASDAVWKSMPCLARFARLFLSSHSKAMVHYEKCKYNCQYRSKNPAARLLCDVVIRVQTKLCQHVTSVLTYPFSGSIDGSVVTSERSAKVFRCLGITPPCVKLLSRFNHQFSKGFQLFLFGSERRPPV